MFTQGLQPNAPPSPGGRSPAGQRRQPPGPLADECVCPHNHTTPPARRVQTHTHLSSDI